MQPIDMILHCPNCGRQHIDAAAPGNYEKNVLPWSNPPHRSHLCHGCGFIWRPADVPTNGVESIATKGNNDDPFYISRANALAIDAGRWRLLPQFISEFQIDYIELVSKIDAELKS